MDEETRAKVAEAALLAVEDIAWTFLLIGIEHAAEWADESDARRAYIAMFDKAEYNLLNIIGEKMEEVKL